MFDWSDCFCVLYIHVVVLVINVDHILVITCSPDAVYTYYRTKSQEQSLKLRGKFDDRSRARRRRERLLRVRSQYTSWESTGRNKNHGR